MIGPFGQWSNRRLTAKHYFVNIRADKLKTRQAFTLHCNMRAPLRG
jgi:hypothetical protein